MGKYSVGIFLYEGVELLDFAGPGEAFSSATLNNENVFDVFTVAANISPILCQNFLTLIPKYSFEDAPHIDILIIPGGDTHLQLKKPTVIEWIKRTSADVKFILTVCTGVLLIAECKLLEGLKATTHYKWIEYLRINYPGIEVIEGVRFIDNGRIITTEGISAGIDGSLYMIEKLFDHDVAAKLAQYMMYDWTPRKL